MVYQTSPDIVMFSYITTDCFNACLLDIILHKLLQGNWKRSTILKPQNLSSFVKVKWNLQRNSIFKVKILKTQFLAELVNRFTSIRP